MKHLFKHWDKVSRSLKNRDIFLFLDYDGTLAPIARTPQAAVLPLRTKILLEKIINNSKICLAIVSGRSVKTLQEKMGIKGIIYSGNHGLEIAGPKIRFSNPIPLDLKKLISKIKGPLNKALKNIKGVFVEDKKETLSVHYRMVRKEEHLRVKSICFGVIGKLVKGNKLAINSGKKILEIKPRINWNKGKAVLWILKNNINRAKNKAVPVYIGDDKTDEDAFVLLRKKGITVFVGNEKARSHAEYYVRHSGEVFNTLKNILLLK